MRKMRNVLKPLQDQRGFNLIELMIALVIITLVIGGYVGANVMAQRNTEEMNERTIAIQDANRAIERIRNVSKTGDFPDDTVSANLGLSDFDNLLDEEVTVAYQDELANPLNVTVTVTWTSYPVRTSTETVQTYITQR